MKNKLICGIRAILTLGMIYMAYTETGIWTALCLLGCYVAVERHQYIIKRDRKVNYERYMNLVIITQQMAIG